MTARDGSLALGCLRASIAPSPMAKTGRRCHAEHMPRQLLNSLTGLLLSSLSGAATALVVLKLLRDEGSSGFDFYTVSEEWAFVVMLVGGVVIALAAPLFAVALLVHWALHAKEFSSAPRVSLRQIARLPLVVGAWYLLSGASFFALDGAFTRLGGTTPFCYEHPFLGLYEPVASTLWRAGLPGGGRYVNAYLADTWRHRPHRPDAAGPARHFAQTL
jgi:hypothetical protein